MDKSNERLTQTSDKGGVAFTFDLDVTCQPSEMKKILRLAEKLKEYEDAEDKGLLLKLPCKPGDTIFVIPSKKIYKFNEKYGYFKNNRVEEQIVCAVRINENGRYTLFTCDGFQSVVPELYKETWFLKREEAEQKLSWSMKKISDSDREKMAR